MFTRPPFTVVAVTLGGLAVALVLMIAPPDFWWERIDPIGSSVSRLATAQVFYVGVHDVEGQVPSEIRRWRTIAAADRGDSLFAELARRGSPAGRVYAVLGLQHLNSRRLEALSAPLREDTTSVDVAVPCRSYMTMPLREVLSLPDLPEWRRFLESWSPESDTTFRCVPPN